jgi:predicted DNA-binding ribbon-helix-helix protein
MLLRHVVFPDFCEPCLPSPLVPMAPLRTRRDFPASKGSTKRSINFADHKTSVSLEKEFWDCLKEIAVERDVSLGALVAAIDANRQNPNLSAAIRIFVLEFYRYRLGLAPVSRAS